MSPALSAAMGRLWVGTVAWTILSLLKMRADRSF
jgi:hypothetical protein